MKNKIETSRANLIADKSSQNCTKRESINVSVDRITLVAELSLDAWEEHYFDWLSLPFIQSKGAGLQVLDFSSEDKVQQIAYIEMPEYHTDKIRVDFNPNHSMNTEGGDWLIETLHKLPNKHFSRLDIAIDVFNYPDLYLYDFYKFGASKTSWRGRGRKLETNYWGSRTSQQQIRLYDKKVEQKNKGKTVEFESWWRLEFQLRGHKASNYFKVINDMLDDFYIVDYKNPNLTDSEQNKLLRLMVDDDYYGSCNLSKKRRLRKLVEKSEADFSISKKIKSTFNASSANIDKTLHYYLDCSYPPIRVIK